MGARIDKRVSQYGPLEFRKSNDDIYWFDPAQQAHCKWTKKGGRKNTRVSSQLESALKGIDPLTKEQRDEAFSGRGSRILRSISETVRQNPWFFVPFIIIALTLGTLMIPAVGVLALPAAGLAFSVLAVAAPAWLMLQKGINEILIAYKALTQTQDSSYNSVSTTQKVFIVLAVTVPIVVAIAAAILVPVVFLPLLLLV